MIYHSVFSCVGGSSDGEDDDVVTVTSKNFFDVVDCGCGGNDVDRMGRGGQARDSGSDEVAVP